MKTPAHGLSEKSLATVIEILDRCPAVEAAILYGSRAKGTHRPGSDIDLTLVGESLNQDLLARLGRDFDESSLPYMVDLSIKAKIDNPNLLDHIERVGVVLFERAEKDSLARLPRRCAWDAELP